MYSYVSTRLGDASMTDNISLMIKDWKCLHLVSNNYCLCLSYMSLATYQSFSNTITTKHPSIDYRDLILYHIYLVLGRVKEQRKSLYCHIGLGDSMNISEYRDSIAIGYHLSLGKLLLDSNQHVKIYAHINAK